ncbi:RNA-binding S4 domain-containing protein [Martelella alba]|uniref:RNA-binding S4 domain-containing protein n=1 Tax=Martelella alba TaxID=2590451 RepID=A0A506UGU7_9HYPH|nr:RNA-binding S4 domain-containing protein [Martelella alba]TPW32529.1 RNA-binding S4 domain-containing protein [Martelella alba]
MARAEKTEIERAGGERQRIDKWLFFTRMVKSRSLAQKLIDSGHVKVNGQKIARSSIEISPGDRVGLTLERRDVVLVVVAPGNRRGPYEEAQRLYEDHSPPVPKRESLTPFEQAQRVAGSGRPTKKERRALDRLTGEDDL